MSSWNVNPSTGDYLIQDGKPVPTESLVVPAYYRIMIPRGQWMYAPNTKYGNDAALLKKKNGSEIVGMTERALHPLVDDGRALSVAAQINPTIQTNRNNAALSVALVDAQGQPQFLAIPSIGV